MPGRVATKTNSTAAMKDRAIDAYTEDSSLPIKPTAKDAPAPTSTSTDMNRRERRRDIPHHLSDCRAPNLSEK